MVDKIKAQARALIRPQLETHSHAFQDACKDFRFGPKRPEWEATQLAEAAVGKYVEEQTRIVSESLSTVIRSTNVLLTQDAIQEVFLGLLPDMDQTRGFVYEPLRSFGIPGTPGVGIEFDKALRIGKELETAMLNLLPTKSESEHALWSEAREDGMPRRQEPGPIQPSLSHEKAHQALIKQLAELERLKGRRFDEADSNETEWGHLTQSIVERAFGSPSSNLTKYYQARNAGIHNYLGIDDRQKQTNFELRTKEYESLLRSLVSELKLLLPDEEIKGVYEPDDEYGFYRDLSSLIANATKEVFIVDVYLDDTVFNLYVDKVPGAVSVRILSNNITANVETIAKMYARNKPLELRSSVGVHDRVVFVDQRGWVVGQSIKDAAKKKPTYMIEMTEPLLTASRNVHSTIWSAARVTI